MPQVNRLVKFAATLRCAFFGAAVNMFLVSFLFHANENQFTSTLDYCTVELTFGVLIMIAVTGHCFHLLDDGLGL